MESLNKYVGMMNWHPANKLSMIHHRDVATAVRLALTGACDGRIVNMVDDAPTSVYEILGLVGATMEPSSRPAGRSLVGPCRRLAGAGASASLRRWRRSIKLSEKGYLNGCGLSPYMVARMLQGGAI